MEEYFLEPVYPFAVEFHTHRRSLQRYGRRKYEEEIVGTANGIEHIKVQYVHRALQGRTITWQLTFASDMGDIYLTDIENHFLAGHQATDWVREQDLNKPQQEP